MAIGRCDYDSWRRRIDQLVRKMGGGSEPALPGQWSPPTDVFETADGIVVKMELPGVRPEDLSIHLVDDHLVVKGRRVDPDAGRKIQYHQMEICFGTFAKVVFLRLNYERDGITATLKDGYLNLVIPRSREPRRERIAVEIRL
jgi:HSP20 family protein